MARLLAAGGGINRYEVDDRTSYAPEEVDGVEKLPNLLATAVQTELFKIEKHVRRETRE